jgi:hypothetical protein
MGSGSFDATNYSNRAVTNNYHTASTHEIFKQRNINSAMTPYGIKVRESRDSSEHPESLAIVLGLDVTGSMGSIPHHLVKEGLPLMVDKITKKGILHPQILFLGIGDHEYDNSPLQVGQFESSDELLEKWLTTVFLEGGGGGNLGESYLLAWYFAAYHTSIDCLEKRNQKGFLFTIGDEPVLPTVPKKVLSELMGSGQYDDFTAHRLFEEANKKYHTYHIHVKETSAGSRRKTIDDWQQLLRDNLLVVDRYTEIPDLIASKVNLNQGSVVETKSEATVLNTAEETAEEMML